MFLSFVWDLVLEILDFLSSCPVIGSLTFAFLSLASEYRNHELVEG